MTAWADVPTIMDRFEVVLVEPGNSANVGAVARALANLGFSRLHLVSPRRYDRDLAAVSACWATPLLDSLQIHDDLPSALAGAQDVVGFSMRAGVNPPHWMDLPQWVGELTDAFPTPPAQTALVFGPEENGLHNTHLEHCRRIVRIPSAAECPSFNLAQSVLVVLYELTRSLPDKTAVVPSEPRDLPTRADIAPLERLLDAVMRESGFVRPGTPGPVPGIVRNLFRRLQMDRHELGILMGLFGRLRTAARRGDAAIEKAETNFLTGA